MECAWSTAAQGSRRITVSWKVSMAGCGMSVSISIFSFPWPKPGASSRNGGWTITATVHTARWTGRVRRHTGQPINPQHGQEPPTYLWYREGRRVNRILCASARMTHSGPSLRLWNIRAFIMKSAPSHLGSGLINHQKEKRSYHWHREDTMNFFIFSMSNSSVSNATFLVPMAFKGSRTDVSLSDYLCHQARPAMERCPT